MFRRILLVFGLCWIGLMAPIQNGRAQDDTSSPRLFGEDKDWINTDGKPVQWKPGTVLLVDFWEYTCVNCLRTLPYLEEWHRRYAKDGLVIVGVHTPEFAFAKEHTNVAAAVKRLGITYPVLVDSDYKNWYAWQGENGYWPRKFLVDSKGKIVFDHAGEGGYGETEQKIQELLKEAHPGIVLPKILEPIRAEDKPGAVCYPATPEMYAGARGFQNGQHGSVQDYQVGQIRAYKFTGAPDDGKFYLQGAWQTNEESVRHARETHDRSDFVAIRYHALSCNAVIKPDGGHSFLLYVWQDGKPVERKDAGDDVRYDKTGRSYITVDAPRMYGLTKNKAFGRHVLKLASDSTAFGLFSFTFTSCVAPN